MPFFALSIAKFNFIALMRCRVTKFEEKNNCRVHFSKNLVVISWSHFLCYFYLEKLYREVVCRSIERIIDGRKLEIIQKLNLGHTCLLTGEIF